MKWVLVVLVVLAGCGGDDTPAGSGSLSDEEINWIQSAGRWEQVLTRQSQRAYAVRDALLAGESGIGALERAFQPVAQCVERQAAQLGKPPTERLRDHDRVLRRACDQAARGAELEVRGAKGDTRALAETQVAWSDANELLLQWREQLRPLLAKDLEHPRGRAGTNRTVVEPRLSTASSRIVRKDVQIVCPTWDDWDQLTRERNALWGEPLAKDFAGFADYLGARARSSCQTSATSSPRSSTTARGSGRGRTLRGRSESSRTRRSTSSPRARKQRPSVTGCSGSMSLRCLSASPRLRRGCSHAPTGSTSIPSSCRSTGPAHAGRAAPSISRRRHPSGPNPRCSSSRPWAARACARCGSPSSGPCEPTTRR